MFDNKRCVCCSAILTMYEHLVGRDNHGVNFKLIEQQITKAAHHHLKVVTNQWERMAVYGLYGLHVPPPIQFWEYLHGRNQQSKE